MIALVNSSCDYGKGGRAWRRIEPILRARYHDLAVKESTPGLLTSIVTEALSLGRRRFIAAGGDGTVNAVANALLMAGSNGATLGAVALGSSNDFHKPRRAGATVGGVRAKLWWEEAFPRDIIQVRWVDQAGRRRFRACLLNAGIGITAYANAVYNGRIPVIRRLQGLSVEAAILASVIHALRTFRPSMLEVSLDGAPSVRMALTNLAVLKSPHVGGALTYDTPVSPDDGRMVVNICLGMNVPETVRTLLNLYRRRFVGRPKTHSSGVTACAVSGSDPFALEMDGEVVHARSVEFCLARSALRCCP